jgi:hypothetical protein
MATKQISCSIDTTGVKRRFAAILKAMPASLKSGLREWALRTIAAIRMKNRGRPGTIPRTGNLNRSWDHKEYGQRISDVTLNMFNTAIYARVQELGKTIRPRTAGALAIPLEAALTGNGTKKWASPTAQGGLWLVPAKTGAAFLCGPGKGAENRLIQYWILKKSVYVPPRMGAHETVGQRRDVLIESLGAKVSTMMHRG